MRTSRITSRVRGTRLATDGRETDRRARLVTDLVEDGGAGEVADVVRDLKVAVRAGTLGVHDALGDALAVEVGEEVDVVEVCRWRSALSARGAE